VFLAGSPLQVLDSLVVSSEQFHDESGMVFIRTIFCSRLPLMHHSGLVSSLNDSLTGRVAMATVPFVKNPLSWNHVEACPNKVALVVTACPIRTVISTGYEKDSRGKLRVTVTSNVKRMAAHSRWI